MDKDGPPNLRNDSLTMDIQVQAGAADKPIDLKKFISNAIKEQLMAIKVVTPDSGNN